MEAINFITDWTKWFILLVPTGAGAMIGYQSLRKTLTNDQGVIDDCNRKMKHTMYGAIIIVTISGFIQIVKSFYN